MTEPVTWIKHKYAAPKDKGRYKSSHNDNGKSTRKKTGPKNPVTETRMTLVIRNGKRHWAWL